MHLYCGYGKWFQAHMSDIWWLYFQLRLEEFVVWSLDGNTIWPTYAKLIDTRNAGGRKLDVSICDQHEII
jgi:hypothetical protein